MNVHHIQTTRTARFYTLINNDLPIHTVMFVLHGYGMSAERFIQQFETVLTPGLMIVAPEGLSRFYRKGHSGDVVASWMTRDDRDSEILDYITYLNEVCRQVTDGHSAKLVVLGFSQGASTASRWVANGRYRFHAMILWAGEFAPEITQCFDNKLLIWNICGTNDEFINPEKHQQQTERLVNLTFRVNHLVFEGNHQIQTESLKSVLDEFFSVSN